MADGMKIYLSENEFKLLWISLAMSAAVQEQAVKKLKIKGDHLSEDMKVLKDRLLLFQKQWREAGLSDKDLVLINQKG